MAALDMREISHEKKVCTGPQSSARLTGSFSQAWNFTETMEVMASVASGTGLGAFRGFP